MSMPFPSGPGGSPPSITLPGPGGPSGPGPGPSDAGPGPSDAGPGDPDSANVTAKLRQALKLVHDAAAQEGDDQDAAALTKIASLLHTAIANEQGLVDKAMGAGPGVKLVRKAAAGGAGPVGGY